MDSPLLVTLYDKTFTRTAWLEDLDRLKVNPRHLLIPTVDLDVPIDYRFLPELTERGARITVVNEEDGEQVFSGPIRPWTGTGPDAEGTITLTAEGDERILWNLLGYPSPGQPADNQTSKEDVRTGNAESVLKGFISANIGRWGRPISVAPNLNRGSNITAAVRMVPLADKLLPVLEGSGIGFTVRQVGAGLVVDCYEQRLFPIDLTEDGGVVQDYSLAYTPPSATRAIIGGPNTGTSREFKLYVDTAREQHWDPMEIVTDAGDEVNTDTIIAKGKAAVDEAGEKYGATITLDETSIFRYGGADGIHRGDQVSVILGPGIRPINEVVREPELSVTRDEGYTAKFSVGDTDNPDAMIATTLDELVRGIRDLRTR
ncbi:hypothetical protein GCM10009616_35690 [Microlunatus lacustris]